METTTKKRIWRIVISTLIIGVIIFVTAFTTWLVSHYSHEADNYIHEKRGKLTTVFSFLEPNEDNVSEEFHCRCCNLYISMDTISFLTYSYPWQSFFDGDRDLLPLFYSSETEEWLARLDDFNNNLPDLKDVEEAYKNGEIDILQAKRLCYDRLIDALEESGLELSYDEKDGVSYIALK